MVFQTQAPPVVIKSIIILIIIVVAVDMISKTNEVEPFILELAKDLKILPLECDTLA